MDRLTGLFDSSYLEEPLRIELARARRFKRDLGFLLIEPTLTQPAPDLSYKILKRLALQITAQTREVDVAIRWDSLVLLVLPETPQEGLQTVVDRLEKSCSRIQFDTETGPTGIRLKTAFLTYGEFSKKLPPGIDERTALLNTLRRMLHDLDASTEGLPD